MPVKKIGLILSVFLFLPVAALAAPAHSLDDCSGTSEFTALCGTGGSGWSGDWTNNSANSFIGATASCQTSNCVKSDTAGDNATYRTFTSMASGHGRVYIKRTGGGNTNNFSFDLCAQGSTSCTASGKFGFNIQRTGIGGAVNFYRSGGSDSLGTWTTDTWQEIQFEWGTDNTLSGLTACTAGQARANFAGGTWSVCRSMNVGNDPGTVQLNTDDTTGGDTFWVDEILFGDNGGGGGAGGGSGSVINFASSTGQIATSSVNYASLNLLIEYATMTLIGLVCVWVFRLGFNLSAYKRGIR